MKKLILSAIIIAGTVMTAAAQVRTAYFIESTTYRAQFNPAFAPTHGYVNFPALGGINFNLDGTLSVNDLIKQRPDGTLATILSSAFTQKEAFKGLNKHNNSFNFNTNLNIIGFGSYTKNHKNFWSFDINLHAEAAVDIPFALFDFAKNISTGNSKYDMSKMQVFAQSYVDFGFNYSMPIMENLYVGARAKFLVGLAQGKAGLSSFDMNLTENEWSISGQAEMTARLNGLNAPAGGDFDSAKFGFKGPSGYGFAIDLGATYDVLENLQVSLAVNDIGFISWNNAVTFRTDKEGFKFDGADIVVNGSGVDTSDFDDKFSFDNFDLLSSGSGKGGATALRATINAGAEYEMWNHWVGFGLLYHARMGLYKSSHNLTASVNFHPVYWFTLSPSYTFNNNRGGAIGLALNLAPRGFNFFLATDILTTKLSKQFIPIKQDRMTFTMGIGFNIGRHGYRIKEYATKWQAQERAKQEKATAKANAKAAAKASKTKTSGTKVSTK